MNADAPPDVETEIEAVPHGLRRWGGYIALVLVFATACGFLSWWQWSRNAETVAETRLVDRNWTQPPVPLDELVPSLDGWRHDLEWREVALHGRYLTDEQLLVRNRVRNANPGFEVLVPFRLDDGRVFVVDRGWLPIPQDAQTPQVPAPPSGEVSVVARLQQSEADLPGRTSPHGQIASIDLPAIAQLVGERSYTGAYGTMTRETPAPATRPAAAPKPVIDPGPFLSYAIQWIIFGVLAFVGLFWAYRREKRLHGLTVEQRAVLDRAGRRSRDSDYEDAVLDRTAD
jgi:cytochrome oxidase assembly protein ShyY1